MIRSRAEVISTVGRNGLGAFVLQCKKMDFHFCDWAGSSRGMNGFIRSLLPRFARENPEVEITVSPRPAKHPVIMGHYINGTMRSICVRNMEPYQVLKKAELIRSASGEKVRKVRKPVQSINDSVRGIWSPYHGYGFKV